MLTAHADIDAPVDRSRPASERQRRLAPDLSAEPLAEVAPAVATSVESASSGFTSDAEYWRAAAHRDRNLPRPLSRLLSQLGWTVLSIALFAAIWELLWAVGLADPKLLPPPHVFLGNFADQAQFFNTAQRWQIGADINAGPSPWQAVLITVFSSGMRVFAGITIAAVLALSLGLAIRYWIGVERLVLPTVTLLSPVSPIAWLPVAIFLFGIGNAPAIFMVVIALFFQMTIATITHVDSVPAKFLHVARTMGATRFQIYRHVIVPSILPGVFAILRLNLFAAWMVVLIAESTGVGYGLGQVIMMARNTFNPSLVFFCIALIGLLGFFTDWLMRQVQHRVLYWIADPAGELRGL